MRDVRIDILKFVGILCIILAHVETPTAIFALRNFDVVLMVMLTGTSYYVSSYKKHRNYLLYIGKRFQRLIIPTWHFLVLFFVLFYIFFTVQGTSYPFEAEKVLRSFLLIDGIGYVWIMRIYFLSALLCPLILKISQSVRSNTYYFAGLFIIYILYEGIIDLGQSIGNSVLYDLYYSLLVDGIGWGILVAVGMRIYRFSKRELLLGICVLALVFMGLALQNDFSYIQGYKYPPTLYYTSYGLCVSFILWLLLENNKVRNFMNNKLVIYIAKNSFEIYLYHIGILYVISFWGTEMPVINYNWASRFFFVTFFAIVFNVLQKYLVTLPHRFAKVR